MLLNGKVVAEKIYDEIKEGVAPLERKPKMDVLLIGEDKSALAYIRGIKSVAKKVGIEIELIQFDEQIAQDTLISEISEINKDETVDAIMLQMPLPRHMDKMKVINSIASDKDIDGLTEINLGKLFVNNKKFVPCTAQACIETLDFYDVDLEGKDVTIVGRSNIVGKPLIHLLLEKNATVTTCHSRTQKIEEKTKKADVVIVAVGIKDFLTKKMVTPESIVLDVGINVVDGKVYGDADFVGLDDYVEAITPVPGGIGSVTTALLLKNTLKAYKINKANIKHK